MRAAAFSVPLKKACYFRGLLLTRRSAFIGVRQAKAFQRQKTAFVRHEVVPGASGLGPDALPL